MLTKALIVNAIVLFAVLEADLGSRRKIGAFRILRPLLTAGALAPLFLEAVATHGAGLALEIGGGVAGALLGLVATRLMSVRLDDVSGRVVSAAGAAYGALWIAVIAARSCFSIGSQHWFNHALTTWAQTNHVSGASITDTLVIMALAMAIARTLGLAARAQAVRSHAPLVAHAAA